MTDEIKKYTQKQIQDIIDEIRSNRDIAQNFEKVAGYDTAIKVIKKHTQNTT